jgi:uncharacterized protein (DUF1778 family)
MNEKQPFQARFKKDPHSLLRLAADREGRPMDDLVEEYVAQELQAEVPLLEMDLKKILQLLKAYQQSPEQLEKDIEAYAEAEAIYEDPIQARLITEQERKELEKNTESHK